MPTIAIDNDPQQLFSCQATAKCIRAGPGTGKTYNLIRYVEDLILNKRVQPNDIQVLAFTRTAAKEFSARVENQLGLDPDKSPSVRTLHAYSLLQLAKTDALLNLAPFIKVADDFEESQIVIKELASRLQTNGIKVKKTLREYEDSWNSLEIEKPDWEKEKRRIEFEEELEKIRDDYGFILRGELVYQFKKILDADPNLRKTLAPQFLIVDEYQDLNRCDQTVIKHLYEGGSNLVIAGDDDQSIFEFRKANPEGIQNFGEIEYPDGALFTLTICRRCPQEVLNYANRLILKSSRRVEKLLKACESQTKGVVECLQFENQEVEAKGIIQLCEYLLYKKGVMSKDILILVSRSHLASRILDLALERDLKAKLFTKDDPVIKDYCVRRAYSLLRANVNKNDAFAIRTWLETTYNLGNKTLLSFLNWRRQKNLDFIKAINKVKNAEEPLELWMRKVQRSLAELDELTSVLDAKETVPEKIDVIINFQNQNQNENLIEFKKRLESITFAKQIKDISAIVNEIQESQAQNDIVLDDESIRILTMHSAKGLSSRAVILPGMEEDLMPGITDDNAKDERRRLLYVSITRSKEFVFFTHCRIRSGYQSYLGTGKGMPFKRRSSFLDEMRIASEDGNDYLRYIR